MLRGIDPVLSPELLKILCEMGHGDEIVIADANFPSAALAKRLVRADGIGADTMLKAILPLFPLDHYVDERFFLMQTVGDDQPPALWDTFRTHLAHFEPDTDPTLVERFAFYERAKNAYAVIATGERASYGNVILKKGVVKV